MEKKLQNLITDTVIGAALGSFITIVGVWVSNYYQSASQKVDREYKLKSELYMQAAEQLAQLKILLLKLPTLPQVQMDAMLEQNCTATSKITVIASDETVQTVSSLISAWGEKFLKLLPDRIPINNLNIDIQILSSNLEGCFQKQNQMLNEMTAFNLRSDTNRILWQKLQDNFDHHSKQIETLTEKREQKYALLNQATKELVIKCIESVISLTDLEIRAVKAIKKELKIEFNAESYRQNIEASNKKMVAELSKFLVKIPNTA